MSQNVPLVDLKAQHAEIAEEVREGWDKVLARTAFVMADELREFEEAFAEFTGVRHCVGVGNGTDAIELLVRACGLGPGDEVIVPANTFIATAVGILRAGARPAVVDCDEYGLLDPEKTAAAIGAKTRALMPVHLFGQSAAMEQLAEVARQSDLVLLEDHAQSQGAAHNGRPCGSFGHGAATSFFPGKNLGAYGDGGAVLTSDEELVSRLRHLRNYGSEKKYFHPEVGFNSRLDTLQAVVLSAKLKRLPRWNEQRRAAAERYDELLKPLGVEVIQTMPGNEHVHHLYVIKVAERDAVLSRLHEAGIGAGIHYPTPLHLHGALSDLGYEKGAFPVAERLADEILTLPLFPQISAEQQERVVEALKGALR